MGLNRNISLVQFKRSVLSNSLSLLLQQAEQLITDAVVAEVEIFEMDAVACVADGLEFCIKFLLAVREQLDVVVVRKGYSLFP